MAHTAKSSVIHDNISWCFDRQNGNAIGSRRHHENIEYDPESQQDTESRFARDYVRLHLANRESHTRRRRSAQNPDLSQLYLDLSSGPYKREITTTLSPLGEEGTLPPREVAAAPVPIAAAAAAAIATSAAAPTASVDIYYVGIPSGGTLVEDTAAAAAASSASVIVDGSDGGSAGAAVDGGRVLGSGSNGSGGSFSSSSLLEDLRGHLVTEVRIPNRNDPIHVALSHPSSSPSSSEVTRENAVTSNEVTRDGPTSNEVTNEATTATGVTPLRIAADGVDYHDVVFEER